MSNPTKIDRAFFRAFRSDLEDALAAVAEKHGVSVKAGRASYAYTNGSIKLEIAQLSEDGTAVTPEVEALRMLGQHYGINEGATFTLRGTTYTVTGWNSRARKRPVICEREDGKAFVFEKAAVARLINATQDAQKGSK